MRRKSNLQALTIAQPYAHLIATGNRYIENRGWVTRHRGWLAIHAGLTDKHLDDGPEVARDRLAFGAIVAVAWLRTAVERRHLRNLVRKHPDLAWVLEPGHYAIGPACWILSSVYPLAWPVPATGARGLWDVQGRTLRDIRRAWRPNRRLRAAGRQAATTRV